MRIIALTILTILICAPVHAGPKSAPPVPAVVQDEFSKTHQSFLKTFQDSEKAIADLKKERQELIEKYKSQAGYFEEGAEALNKYDLLLVIRNTDGKGDLDERAEVAGEDVTNLNSLFNKYLQSTLLPKRVSVRYARKILNRAKRDLERIANDYRDPDDSNNPELEILSKRIEDSTTKSALVTDFAHRIGIDIKRELATE